MNILRVAVFMTFQLVLAQPHVNAADYTELYKRLSPTVVTVGVSEIKGNGFARSTGSGVVIDSSGLVLTAAHVVHTADQIAVRMANGQQLGAELLSSDPTMDLAVIQIKDPPASLSVAELGDSSAVKVGQITIVIGAPFGLERSLSVGVVSGGKRDVLIPGGQAVELLQTDAAINEGNSGGPMFNEKGEVIGVVSRILSKSGGFDGIGFAVSINSAKQLMAAYRANWSGFEGIALNRDLAAALNVDQGSGVLVQRVHEHSPAAKAGLRAGRYKAAVFGREILLGGDIILEIQKTKCDSPHDWPSIRRQLQEISVNQKLEFRILRGGKTLTLTIDPPLELAMEK